MLCFAAAFLAICSACRPESMQAGVAAAEYVEVPVLMYHSLLKDTSRHGKYVLSPDEFEQDLIYLRENGYTSIFASDLAAYVYRGRELPDKPVVITFDDAHLNTFTYAVPLLQQYDMKAVVSVIGAFTEASSADGDHNPNYSYMSWQDIRDAVATGCVEIGNHTYDMHSQGSRYGAERMRGEDEKLYADALALDLLKLQDALEQNCGVKPAAFAYPFGAVSDESLEVVKELGFQVSFGCYEKVNRVGRGCPEDLYRLGRFNRPSGIGTYEFMKRLK